MRTTVLDVIRKAAQPVLSPPDNRGGWAPFVSEPYTGAWQKNDSWTIDSVLAYPVVYACINMIADDIAKLPPHTIKRDSDDIWSVYENKALQSVLDQPNPYQNHIQFKQWWMTSKLSRGNTYVLKVRDGQGDITALYVLEPRYCRPLIAPDGSVWYQLSQDWLNGVTEVSTTVPASEIIHDRMNCMFHPLVGISPLFASGLAAQLGLSIENESTKFFKNGARPGGILTAPGQISQETATRLKEYWDNNFTGAKAGRIAVIGDDLKYQQLRMSSVDSQQVEQLKWLDNMICSTFKIPAYKVNVGAMPTHNNIEALTTEYYTQCLQVHIESMELCQTNGLEMKPGTGIELNLDVLFRMDSSTLVKTLTEGLKGLYKPDEARKRLNLSKVEGGNAVYMQQQNFSLPALAKRDAREDPFSTSGNAPVPDVGDDQSENVSSSDVQSEALNGAQVTALQGIIAAVASGQLPSDTARWMILAAFPFIDENEVDSMLRPLEDFTPEPAVDDTAPTDEDAGKSQESFASITKLLPLFLREELLSEN
jgi:HK97 family phage portal protein